MNRGDAETQRLNQVSERIIGCAINVHRALGPGLLEWAYEECLCLELKPAGMPYARQVPLPLIYRGTRLDCGYRLDVIVQNELVLEVKAVERLLPIHDAQILSYLRLGAYKTGLLLNFHTMVLKDGIRRFVL